MVGSGGLRTGQISFFSCHLRGAILAYFALGFIAPRIPYFLTISAASFLYIGMVDIAPILHHDSGLKKSFVQLTGLFAGVATILILHQALA